MRKLYPTQISLQPPGHWGIDMDWLWTAITLVGASHTEHLDMYLPISGAGIGVIIIGIGSVVLSQ